MQQLRSFFFFSFFTFCFLPLFSQVPDSIINSIQAYPEIDSSVATVVIGDVRISGFKKTKPYIINREIPFRNGDVIVLADLPKKLQLCHDQLMNTSLFVDVDVTIERRVNQLVFINVHIKERWYLFPLPYFRIVDRNFNTWWVEQKRNLNRVDYGLKFMQNNVSGRNDNLNIWLITGYTQQASIRYENPFLDKSLKHGMNVGFSYSRNREMNVATIQNKQTFYKEDHFLVKQIHFDAAYTYRPAIKTRHHFRVSYTDQTIHDSIIAKNPNYFGDSARRVRFFDMNYSIQYFNVDYIPYPLKGFMGDAYVYKRSIGAKNNVFQIGGKGTYSFKLAPKSFMQFQGAAMLRLPFKQPYFNQRMFGSGDFYMRGLEYYIIDGAAGGFARATAKQQVLSFSVRNIIASKTHDKIPFRVFLKGYGDAGYSYNPEPGTSIFNNRLLRTWGAGIDIVTFYDIVVKLEYSFNQRGESGLFIHTKSDF